MNCFLRREPVVNRQMAVTASRFVVHAPTAAEAVRTLDALAGVWPTTRNVLVSLGEAPADEALLAWRPPENALLEFPAAALADATGRFLALRLDAGGTPLCLDGFTPGGELPTAPKFRFILVDAGRHPEIQRMPGVSLAKCLTDHETFADAVDNGYSGAVGWFFLHGLPAFTNKLNPGHAQIIHILNLVRQNADVTEVENALKQDISISFKLLRYINSAGFGLAKEIHSFRHAVTLIGYDKLNKWLSLLLVTASRDPAASALMQTAIVRGRFMELAAAGSIDKRQIDNLFITGSFSLLDVLLGTQIEAVLQEMHLPAAIGEALLAGAGPYAPWLALALACERDDVVELAARAAARGRGAGAGKTAPVGSRGIAPTQQHDRRAPAPTIRRPPGVGGRPPPMGAAR
jgi:EAL and modified HD-GYP domain-containing signal transduction protein